MHAEKDDTNRTRRSFLRSAGAGTAACLACLAGSPASKPARAAEAADSAPKKPAASLQLALASYTLRKFKLDDVLTMTQRVGLKSICLKSFHLPISATDEEIAAARAKVEQAGIRLYGGGVIGMNDPEQVDRAFEYAKAAGMTHIIAGPSPEMLPLIDKKVQQYDIEVCIHNHGPGDRHFPTPDEAYEKIKQLDPRVGICHDVGHTMRYGVDPVASTKRCAERILDIHLKDVNAATKAGHSVPCGRGVIDLPGLLRTLIDVGYKGYVSFEYEQQPDDPIAGLAESVGYVRGVLDVI